MKQTLSVEHKKLNLKNSPEPSLIYRMEKDIETLFKAVKALEVNVRQLTAENSKLKTYLAHQKPQP